MMTWSSSDYCWLAVEAGRFPCVAKLGKQSPNSRPRETPAQSSASACIVRSAFRPASETWNNCVAARTGEPQAVQRQPLRHDRDFGKAATPAIHQRLCLYHYLCFRGFAEDDQSILDFRCWQKSWLRVLVASEFVWSNCRDLCGYQVQLRAGEARAALSRHASSFRWHRLCRGLLVFIVVDPGRSLLNVTYIYTGTRITNHITLAPFIIRYR
jgi:hypothetical protein